jgi:Fur family peroxide stress response transcriptional regulator
MFADAGVAKMITIDERRICYDADTSMHGHFYCRSCGKVYDIFPSETLQQMCYKEVDGRFRSVEECDLYYKGVCEECAARVDAFDDEN